MPAAGNYYGPTYQQYLEAFNLGSAEDDAGNRPKPMSEQEWEQLTPYQQHQNAQMSGGMLSSSYDVDPNDPLYQQFYQQFGQNEAIANSGYELGNQRQIGLALGYDSGNNGVAGPGYGRLDWNQYAIDPSRIMWLDPEGTPGRRYLYERSNARGDAVAGEQHRESQSGLGDNAGLIMGGIVLGGGLLANGGFIPGVGEAGAGAVGEVPVGGMLPESVAPQVTEAMLGSPWDIAPGYLSESVAPQVTEQLSLNPFDFPEVVVAPNLSETVAPQVTEPMAASPFDRPWWRDLGRLGRDLLGGPGGTGAGSIIGALMGQGGGKIGGHATDNDPYGLIASGYGPWTGLLDKPKDKVVEALSRRSRTMGI